MTGAQINEEPFSPTQHHANVWHESHRRSSSQYSKHDGFPRLYTTTSRSTDRGNAGSGWKIYPESAHARQAHSVRSANSDVNPRIFQHRPLNLPNRDFRIIKVQPYAPGKPIRCDMRHVGEWAGPSYTALSYTWGNQQALEPVMIGYTSSGGDYEPFTTNKNLHDLLLHISRMQIHEPLRYMARMVVDRRSLHHTRRKQD